MVINPAAPNFFHQFLSHRLEVGAIAPSSYAAALEITSQIKPHTKPIKVLEVGAGTGAFTIEIIKKLKPGDTLDAVEINPHLMSYILPKITKLKGDPKHPIDINLIVDDIRNLPASNRYHHIVFSLPLTNFPPKLTEEILAKMVTHLRPGGTFSYIKYRFVGHLKYLLSNDKSQKQYQAYKKIINHYTNKYQVAQVPVWLNLPPAWIYHWQKP